MQFWRTHWGCDGDAGRPIFVLDDCEGVAVECPVVAGNVLFFVACDGVVHGVVLLGSGLLPCLPYIYYYTGRCTALQIGVFRLRLCGCNLIHAHISPDAAICSLYRDVEEAWVGLHLVLVNLNHGSYWEHALNLFAETVVGEVDGFGG